jgi:3-deoxy-D-manno-octulosonate 8-phosphate phosphatase (KDO 8-P phosphatase)
MTYSGKKNLKLNTEKIKVVVTDVDGVLTNGKIFYFNGQLYRFFNIKDGPAFCLLKLAGIKTVVLSGKGSAESKRRFEELKVEHYFENVKDKTSVLKRFNSENSIQWDEICYIGDDLQDIPLMKKVGFAVAPFDAVPEVKGVSSYICKKSGGEGVFRETTEIILKGRGLWEEILQKFLSL